MKVKTRMTTQFADIFQDLGTDFFRQICSEAVKVAKGKRVSLKEVMAATNLVLGRSKLAERCIQAGVDAIKKSGVLEADSKEKETPTVRDVNKDID